MATKLNKAVVTDPAKKNAMRLDAHYKLRMMRESMAMTNRIVDAIQDESLLKNEIERYIHILQFHLSKLI